MLTKQRRPIKGVPVLIVAAQKSRKEISFSFCKRRMKNQPFLSREAGKSYGFTKGTSAGKCRFTVIAKSTRTRIQNAIQHIISR